MLHLLKIQLALTLILETTAKYRDAPSVKTCPDELIEPCKCLHLPYRSEIIVKCIYPIIRNYRFPPSQAISADPIESLNKHAICALSIENGHFIKFDRSVGDYIKAPIVVMRNSVIMENFDMFEAFRGMDGYLYALLFRNVAMENVAFNETVKGFRQFRIFHLEECSTSFNYNIFIASAIISRLPKTVCEIVIKNCRVEALQINAFQRYKGLRHLDLSRNYLRSVSRSNLPRPATNLLSYNISYNPILSLPDDMFAEMPALKIVSLRNTLFATLHYYTFEPVLNQLDWLEISEIALTCDCEASWLTVNLRLWKKTERDIIVCRKTHSPLDAISYELSSLEPLDLCISCEKVMLEKTTFTSNLK